MAIKLNATYCKRLGLPGYSSHQFSVSIETELVTTDDVPSEAGRIYQLLQSSVDEQLQATGFVPPTVYGMESADKQAPSQGSPHATGRESSGRWKCSDKQRDFITSFVAEHQLDKQDVETLAQERFGKGVRLLNKVEASGLIDELIDAHGGGRRPSPRNGSAYSGVQPRRTR